MLSDPQPLPPALPELHRSSSATQMQAAFRKHAARNCLRRFRHAVIVLQSLLRGWRARRHVERWRTAVRAVLEADSFAERAVEVTTACAHVDTEVPALRMSHLRRSSCGKSQKLTLRLRDETIGVGVPFRSRAEAHSPSHFDVVVDRDATLHDSLYESGKRHFAAGLFERALVDFHLTLHHLEKIERRNARAEGRTPRFDPESTGFRNLDDYVDKCNLGIQRRRRRAMTDVRDDSSCVAMASGAVHALVDKLQVCLSTCSSRTGAASAIHHDRHFHLSPRPL